MICCFPFLSVPRRKHRDPKNPLNDLMTPLARDEFADNRDVVVRNTKISDGLGDTYRLIVSISQNGLDYIFRITQKATWPFQGLQEVRFSLEEWKRLEAAMPQLRRDMRFSIKHEDYDNRDIHIGGPIHADVYYAGDRGPTILLYMGVFNWVKTAIEKDVFGQVALDSDAFLRLLDEMKTINEAFPAVSEYQICQFKHNGQRSAMACNICNPWGLRFV